jgi:hypothetical protein
MVAAAADISFEQLRAQFEDDDDDSDAPVAPIAGLAAAASAIEPHAGSGGSAPPATSAAPHAAAVEEASYADEFEDEEGWTDSDDGDMAAALEWADEREGGRQRGVVAPARCQRSCSTPLPTRCGQTEAAARDAHRLGVTWGVHT